MANRGWLRSLQPGFFRWWNSQPVVALDVTNPEAVAWFVHRLRSLQAATGVDGFKFDAGAAGRGFNPRNSRLFLSAAFLVGFGSSELCISA